MQPTPSHRPRPAWKSEISDDVFVVKNQKVCLVYAEAAIHFTGTARFRPIPDSETDYDIKIPVPLPSENYSFHAIAAFMDQVNLLEKVAPNSLSPFLVAKLTAVHDKDLMEAISKKLETYELKEVKRLQPDCSGSERILFSVRF